MKIFGHRGAAGLELENTLASLQRAINLGVHGIEFDVRKTKDNQLVLCHDADLLRVAGDKRKIADLHLDEVQKVPLINGSHIPTLAEALEVVGAKRVMIEIKDGGSWHPLLDVLKQFPKARASVVSGKTGDLLQIRDNRGQLNIPVYTSELTKPFDAINLARRQKLDGVSFNFWIFNPFAYWLCKRYKLEVFIWTVNRPSLALVLNLFYPEAIIITDYPEKLKRLKR